MPVPDTPAGTTPPPGLARIVRDNVLVAALCLVGGAIAIELATLGRHVTLIWPQAGIAVAAVFISGPVVLPGVAAGAFAVAALLPAPFSFSLLNALGGTLAAALPYLALRRFRPAALHPVAVSDLLWFLALAVVAGPLFSAAAGVLGLEINDAAPGARSAVILLAWWASGALGVLMFAPAVLSIRRWIGLRPDAREWAELALVLGALGAGAALVFGTSAEADATMAFPYVMFPFVIWAAVRLGQCGAALVTLLVAVAAVVATVLGVGPFVESSLSGTLVELDGFLAVMGFSGLLLAAAIEETGAARGKLAEAYQELERQVVVRTRHLDDELAERRRVEAVLRESEARFRAIFEKSPVGIILSDADGNPHQANPAFVSMVGYSATELTGMHYGDYTHPDDLAENRRLFEEMKAGTRDHYMMVKRYLRHDGSHFWGHFDVTRLADGEIPGAYALTVVVDVSAQVAAERRLRTAHKLEAVGELTGGIAHEFNNRLGSILGFAQLAQSRFDSLDPEQMRRYLGEIVRAAERSRDLVRQLLAFSRGSEPGRLPEPIEIGETAAEIADMLGSVLPATVELETRIAENLPPVLFAKATLEEAVINLAINARDALGGKGRVLLATRRTRTAGEPCASCGETTAGEWVELAVEDSGTGIDPALRSRIFDPFFTTKPTGEGTGMGLAMLHGLVHEAGGHVLVGTAREGGAAVRLLLRIAEGEPPRAEPGRAPPAPRRPGRGEHLLLVDDDLAIADFLGELLSGDGYRVTTHSRAADALDAVRRDPNGYDLVITDQTMPGMTGSELADALGRARADLPVILCSGHGHPMNGERTAPGTIATTLTKPVDIEELRAAIRAALREPPQARAVPDD